ncbi:uncharacterized protein LOC119450569 [Dermacentor silvarum]|uniref:uncharacterized protein LOC119450569 n=1 Tax=Dermacentor silvarum TaxID=543639 RepID=UPI00189992BD|nr:uncharacterized protein LOC119450569 [Dermacentor silvarum]
MKLNTGFIVLVTAACVVAYEVNNGRRQHVTGLRSNAFDFGPSSTSSKFVFSGPNALERILSQSIGHSLEQGIISGSGGQRAIVQEIGHGFEPSGGHIIGHTGVHGLHQAFSPGALHGMAFTGIQGVGQGFNRNVGKGLQHAVLPSFTPQLTQGGARGLSQGIAIGAARGVNPTIIQGMTRTKAQAPQRTVGRQVVHAMAPAGSYVSSSRYGSHPGIVRALQPDYGSSYANPTFTSSVQDDFAFGESKVIHGPTYVVHTFGPERDPYHSSHKSYSSKSHRSSKPYVRKAIMVKEKGRHRQ